VQGKLGTAKVFLKFFVNYIETYDVINIRFTEYVNAAVMFLACTWEVPVRIMFPTLASLMFLGFPQTGQRNFGTHRLDNEHLFPTLVHSA
jgi:hypothetical protein